MRCIRCGHDSRYVERLGGTCPSCKGTFAFEPRTGQPFSDASFQAALKAVSADGRLRWGVEHLYYELCRRRRKTGRADLGAFLLLSLMSGLVTGVALGGFRLVPSVLAALGTLAVSLVVHSSGRTLVRLRLDQFNSLWQRWQDTHGVPPGVIVRRPAAKRRQAEPDLADYSFDRTVICDRARTVDLLLANNFHFENNCAVLSVSGYPAGPFETVRAMLKRNPRLHVFALHDATPEGCRLAHLLATNPSWFKGQAIVTDVGLRPGQVSSFRGLFLPASGDAVTPGDGLSPDEARWLARYRLELAAIRPEQLLKRLYRALNRRLERPSAERTSDDVWIEEDRNSFSVEAAAAEGGADGFG